jgi:streptogramin lyase
MSDRHVGRAGHSGGAPGPGRAARRAAALAVSAAVGGAMWLAPASPAFAAPSSSQVTLPFTGLNGPGDVAVDPAGDVFVPDFGNNRVVELPHGSASQITLPFTGLNTPIGVRVRPAGDVFVADFGNNRVVELPHGAVR